jgi:hypothetical protein
MSLNFEKLSITKARSCRYPRQEEDWVNEPIYDDQNGWFDLGYQDLKKVPLHFKELSVLVQLFVDNNHLTALPDAVTLPNITYLSCGHNELKTVPMYPKLVHLDCNGNQIRSLEIYTGSKLVYLDCSSNTSIILPTKLDHLKHLYASENNLSAINFKSFPSLLYANLSQNNFHTQFSLRFAFVLVELDISKSNISNFIDEIDAKALRNLNISHNLLKSAPLSMPNLTDLDISFNQLVSLDKEYPLLKKLTADNNKLRFICNLPNLKKLSAPHNKFELVPKLPKLRYIDLNHNSLREAYVKSDLKYLYVVSNPLNLESPFTFASQISTKLREISMSYPVYLAALVKKQLPLITSSQITIDRKKIVSVFTKLLAAVDEETLLVILSSIIKEFVETTLDNVPSMINNLSRGIAKHLGLGKPETAIVKNNIINVYHKIATVKLFFNNADENFGDEDRNLDALKTTTVSKNS